jgi:hypothetical protein
VSTLPPDEVRAAVEARKELGRENEDAVVEAFLARVEREIDRRVDERLARRGEARPHHSRGPAFPLALVTLALLIPIAEKTTTVGFVVAAIAVVLVNVAYNFRRD